VAEVQELAITAQAVPAVAVLAVVPGRQILEVAAELVLLVRILAVQVALVL
jgi:hypothetical protein